MRNEECFVLERQEAMFGCGREVRYVNERERFEQYRTHPASMGT